MDPNHSDNLDWIVFKIDLYKRAIVQHIVIPVDYLHETMV